MGVNIPNPSEIGHVSLYEGLKQILEKCEELKTAPGFLQDRSINSEHELLMSLFQSLCFQHRDEIVTALKPIDKEALALKIKEAVENTPMDNTLYDYQETYKGYIDSSWMSDDSERVFQVASNAAAQAVVDFIEEGK